MEEYNTYAYFWVGEFDCAPTEITDLLKIEPSRVTLKGEPLNPATHTVRKKSFWEFRSSLPTTEMYQDAHLENLLSVLTPLKNEIAQLQLKYETGISCVGYYTIVNPGFHLSAELIKSCAALNLCIDFDLYNYSGNTNGA
jgi:hypothetical protein